jgi:streptogramin lyase
MIVKLCDFLTIGKADARRSPSEGVNGTVLTSGLDTPIGSTIGPDGALYVAEGPAGRISRVDPETGELTTFASCLPKATIGSRKQEATPWSLRIPR